LFTDEELALWRLIRASKFLWRDVASVLASSDSADWMSAEKYLIYERLREHWDKFKAVARGEADISTLPVSPATDPNPEP
jgi:hypothetical protein